jgi:hypothetical protein
MSCFISYVLLPDGLTAHEVVERGGANERLMWGWGWQEARVMTVADALALQIHNRGGVYSTLVDASGAVYRGYDFTNCRNGGPPHAINRTDADGDWNHWASDPQDSKDRWRCPPWSDFVTRKLRAHVGMVAIVEGCD